MSAGGRSGADAVLVSALASGFTYEAAGKKAGVSERTVRRRLEDEDFQRQLREARAEVVDRSTRMLSQAAVGAVGTLLELLKPPSPPAVRLGAARSILELAVRYRESDDLAEKVGKLNASVEYLEQHISKKREAG